MNCTNCNQPLTDRAKYCSRECNNEYNRARKSAAQLEQLKVDAKLNWIKDNSSKRAMAQVLKVVI